MTSETATKAKEIGRRISNNRAKIARRHKQIRKLDAEIRQCHFEIAADQFWLRENGFKVRS